MGDSLRSVFSWGGDLHQAKGMYSRRVLRRVLQR